MAAFTASQDGNWSSSSTWGGAGVPGSGDTVDTNGHNVTVDVDSIYGISAASTLANVGSTTPDLIVGSGGNLTIAAGKKLTCRGGFKVNNAQLILAAGAILEFDSSLASSPSGTYYYGDLAHAGATLKCNGTSGSHCIIRTTVGSGQGQIFATLHNACGVYDLTYTDLIRMGTDGGGLPQFYGSLTVGNVLSVTHKFHNVTWDTNCYHLLFGNTLDASVGVSILDCRFNSQIDDCIKWAGANSPSGGVTREIKRTVFMASPRLSAEGLAFEDCYLHDSWNFGGPTAGWASCLGIFHRRHSDPASAIFGNVTDCFSMEARAGLSEHHHIYIPRVDDAVVSGCVHYVNGGGQDEFVETDNTFLRVQVDHCILLPSNEDGSGHCLLNAGDTNASKAYHNTIASSPGNFALLMGDFVDTAGMYLDYKSNICWYPSTPSANYHSHDLQSPGTSDTLTNGDYNCGWNLAAGRSLKGYDHTTSVAPGAHDVVLSGGSGPNFVDSSRDLASWAVTRGSVAGTYAGKVADALGYIQNDPTLTRSSLIPYIRAGFAPQNSALKATAHDGLDIGAVSVVSGTTFNQALTATSVVLTAAVQKQVSKNLSATSNVTAAVQKQLPKSMSATSSMSATLQRQSVKLLNGVSVLTASIQRQVGKGLSGISVLTAVVQKQTTRSLTAQTVVTATMNAVKVKIQNLTATSSVLTAAISHTVLKVVSATVTLAGGLNRQVSKTLVSNSAVTGTLNKRSSQPLSATVSALASLTTLFLGSVSSIRVFGSRLASRFRGNRQ